MNISDLHWKYNVNRRLRERKRMVKMLQLPRATIQLIINYLDELKETKNNELNLQYDHLTEVGEINLREEIESIQNITDELTNQLLDPER